MVAISGSSKITPTEQAQLRELITKEFNQFLLNTTLPSLAIIVVIVFCLTFYAYYFISRRINNLTKLVDNPHIEEHKKKIREAATRSSDQPMDEIERLESIFAHFFNEEKYKVKQGSALEHGDRKKVSMLPMRTTLNIFRDPQRKGDKILSEMLLNDLQQDFDLSPHLGRSITEPNALNNFMGASKSFIDPNEINIVLEEEKKNDEGPNFDPNVGEQIDQNRNPRGDQQDNKLPYTEFNYPLKFNIEDI